MKKKFSKLQDLLAAATFAEEGDFDSARELLKEGGRQPGKAPGMPQPAGNVSGAGSLRHKATAFIRRYEKIAGAAAFAEAGEHGYARELAAEAYEQKDRILVVGEADGFPEPLVNYAAGLAERLCCDVVALSVLTLPGSEKSTPDCHARIMESVSRFERSLGALHIGFHHIIKFGDLYQTLKATYHQMTRIVYILLPEKLLPQDRDALSSIPIFCVSQS